jgi:DNA repair exonuclease SbcCD ATPase subunit
MKIQHLTIRNILGIDQLELSPAGFTRIEGPNGTGKTSVLEAIKSAIQSGHDATLLRNGAEKGEVVLVLDDGTSIAKTVTADKSTTDVRGADGKKLPRPAEVIRSLTDMLSVNPVEFLAAPKKDRVKVLLESMPLQIDAAELTAISGIKVQVDPNVHALYTIEAVHKQVYDARTGTNRAVKEKDATIKQLRATIPDAAAGVEGSEDELVEQVQASAAKRDDTLSKITKKLDGIKEKARADIDAIRTELQAAIDRLKAEAQEKVDAINADLTDNQSRASTATEKAHATYTETTAPLNQALAVIRSNREAAAKREQALELVKQMTGELEALRAEAERQTEALEGIERYKADLLKKLPIPGLEVRDGEIYRNDVPLDRLNTAQQVEVAVGVAKLRAGELGIICVDRIESLDDASLAELHKQAADNGLQMFVTRVSNEEFSISTAD